MDSMFFKERKLKQGLNAILKFSVEVTKRISNYIERSFHRR